MAKKVGVLVPIYNCEKYIKRCLESIKNQTYTELEIIIIDDGSTDNSLQICNNIIKNDKRFKIFTRENKGVAFTRNELIKKCTSENFVFIDSDDFIDKNYIEVLENIMKKNNADMVASQIYLNYKGKNKKTDNFKTIIIDNKQGLKKLLYNHELQHGPTCKMYKKELFNNIEFPNGKIYEDLAIMYKVVDKCKNIALTEYQGYNYSYNKEGVTKSKFSNTEISMLEYGEEIFEYVTQKYGDELILPAKNILVEQAIELACKIPLSKQYENEIARIKKYIKEYRGELLKSKETYPRIKAFLIASFLGIRGIKLMRKIKYCYFLIFNIECSKEKERGENMHGIGLGVSDFKMLRARKNYYIDKSLFIKDIVDNQSGVILITRPRRFGKTLNMSMLRYFFDCTRDNTKELFEGLKIMEQGEEYTSKLGYYPCVYITLKDVRGRNFENMMMAFKSELMEIFIEHVNLLNSEKLLDIEKEMFNAVLNIKANEVQTQNALKLLTKLLNKVYEKPVILLVDEYDVPLQSAYVEGYYEEAIEFFRTFYGVTFKDNPYLEKTVLTGVSRVAKESIFSGANNFKVYTVLDKEFSDDFGITREEMKQIIKDFKIEDAEEDIRKWYDGYVIGRTEGIYNPWSILNYLTDRELMPYWVNTSSNDLIKLILKNSATVKEKIERLLRGEAIEEHINLETVIRGIENNEDNIWGLMLGTGYLKVVEKVDVSEGIYKLELPNEEIRWLFRGIIREWFQDKVIGNNLKTILNDLVTLNLKEFEKKFRELTMQMFSYMDVGEKTAENFYHAFVLGMLVGLKDTYYVNSNRESGMGRYDIMLEPQDKSGNSFILEFKVLDDLEENTIEETIENAKKQIEEKKYEETLSERGFTNITKMVFAFKGKEVKMETF